MNGTRTLTAAWRHRLRRAIREAGFLLISAAVLGLAYDGITGKGIFTREGADQRAKQEQPAASPRFITYDEAVQLHQSGGAVFIDSRHDYDFRLGHIPGAVNIPLKELTSRRNFLDSIPRSSTLVTYCDGQECNSSIELAKNLAAAGYRRVNIFFGGWKEWQAHRQPEE